MFPLLLQQEKHKERRWAKNIYIPWSLRVVRRHPRNLNNFEHANTASRTAKCRIVACYLSVLVLNCIIMRRVYCDGELEQRAEHAETPEQLLETAETVSSSMSRDDRRRVLRLVTAAICPVHAACKYAIIIAGTISRSSMRRNSVLVQRCYHNHHSRDAIILRHADANKYLGSSRVGSETRIRLEYDCV